MKVRVEFKSGEVKSLQAIIMWISVLLIKLTEGFRIPSNRVEMRANDDVIERQDWDDQPDENAFAISNDVDHADVENFSNSRNDSIDSGSGMKDKRHNPRVCACPSKPVFVPLDKDDHVLNVSTYPERFSGRECDFESKDQPLCRLGQSCKTITHKMHLLKFKAGHNRKITMPLHHSIRNNFYWEEWVS